MLSVGCSGDVGELENFFDGRKYSHNQVLSMVCCLLDNVLALKEFVRHQLTVVFLEVIEKVPHGVVDGVVRGVEDIREICLLDYGNNLFRKGLLNSHQFAKKMYFLGVRD